MNAVQMEEKDSVIRFAPIPLVPLHAAVRLAILLLDLLAMVSTYKMYNHNYMESLP